LSGKGLCVGLITHPDESYRVCCVHWVWSRSPVRRGHDPESGRSATWKKNISTKKACCTNRTTRFV